MRVAIFLIWILSELFLALLVFLPSWYIGELDQINQQDNVEVIAVVGMITSAVLTISTLIAITGWNPPDPKPDNDHP